MLFLYLTKLYDYNIRHDYKSILHNLLLRCPLAKNARYLLEQVTFKIQPLLPAIQNV